MLALEGFKKKKKRQKEVWFIWKLVFKWEVKKLCHINLKPREALPINTN
jgi:hypothetical protein